MLNLITDLNPNFTTPYTIWTLLLPNYNERYEKDRKYKQWTYVRQAIDLWNKWIMNNCDMKKVSLIKNEYDLKKLWTEDKYKNPCSEPLIPYYVGYIYYWNLFDWYNSSFYYRVTSANTDWPTWSRMMAAIMQWKSWDRQKAILMFLSLAESVGSTKNKECKEFSTKLWTFLFKVFQNKQMFTWKFLNDVDQVRKDVINKLWEKEDYNLWNESQCSAYLNKSVRELNLAYLEYFDQIFVSKFGRNAENSDELMKSWIIDYKPVDYQFSKDMNMQYYFNKDTWHWDAKELFKSQ